MSKPVAERQIQGNPTDGAILKFAESSASSASVRTSFPQIAQVPFNSKNKFALTLHQLGVNNAAAEKSSCLAVVKGAPDVLLPRCSTYVSYETGEVMPLDQEAKALLSSLQNRLSRNAERVLMLCQRKYELITTPRSQNLEQELLEGCMTDLTIIGVLGIFDPPRPETPHTVATCRRAGIRFFMMTGDFGLTGAAIARQIGLYSSEQDPDTFATIKSRRDASPEEHAGYIKQSLLLEGIQISQLEDGDWSMVCGYEEIVLGRCSPVGTQKRTPR